jgi:UDP-N-acetylmuramoylalanine--D-glutamate ligase
MKFTAKSMLVIGAGVSGFAAARIGRKFGAAVTLSDAKAEKDLPYDFSEMRSLGVTLAFGPQEESLLDGKDLVIPSPAVPVGIPIIRAAKARGIRVASEVELAYELADSPIYAVTGTNGKTTTTTLLSQLLATKYGRQKTGLGGNIGVALSEEALRVGKGGAIAAEISSFQMEATEHFHPHISAVLNVTPDHILRHGSMETYQACKEKIFHEEAEGDFVVLNYDDEKTRGMKARVPEGVRVCYFSRQQALEEGAVLEDGRLVLRWDGKRVPLCRVDELQIKGGHNVENALAASAIAYLAGCEPQRMIEALKAFKAVEHRIEYFATVDSVPYYNDSKATNTDSAIKALEAFPGHIVLIAGGDDKMTDLTAFMQKVKERVDELILIGDAAARFREAAVAQGFPEEHIYAAGYSMERAVSLAHLLAHLGQTVLLSPACASFDMYDNMAQRGRHFKQLVRALMESEEDE